jgi:hypothetical protein
VTRCSHPLYFKLSIRARCLSAGDGEATDKPQQSQVPDPIEPVRDDESSPRYAGWRVILACFLMAMFIFGFGLYGNGLYLAELRRLRGWPAALISGAITLGFLFSNLSAIFTSELIDRLGIRRLTTLPPMIIHRGFEASAFTVVLGLSTAISGIVCAFGPGTVGLVRSLSGGYSAALALCIALQLAAAVMVLWSGKREVVAVVQI